MQWLKNITPSSYKKLNLHDACLILPLLCLTVIHYPKNLHIVMNTWLWISISSVLIVLSGYGKTKAEQNCHYIINTLAFFLIASIALYISTIQSTLAYLLLITTPSFILMALSYKKIMSENLLRSQIGLFYFILCNAHLHMLPTIHYALENLLLPFSISCLIIIAMNFILPQQEIPIAKPQIDHYFLKRWCRSLLAILIILYISNKIHNHYAFFAIYTILSINLHNTGAAIHRAYIRISGILLGLILSIPIYPIQHIHWLIHLIAGLSIIAALVNRYKILWRMCFLTLGFMVIHIIAFSHNAYDISHYIVEKIIESLAGVGLAILLELVIFPRSINKDIASLEHDYWSGICKYLASTKHNKKDINQYRSMVLKRVEELKATMDDYKYEPRIILKSYHQELSYLISLLEQLLESINTPKKIKELSDKELDQLHSIAKKIKNYRKDKKPERIAHLKNLYRETHKNLSVFSSHSIAKLIKKIIKHYLQLTQKKITTSRRH